jgi:hypothetical protein
MTDAETIGALQAQVQNYEAERAEAAQVIMQLVNANTALVNANRVLQRQLLDKRGFTSLRVNGRIVVMGRN